MQSDIHYVYIFLAIGLLILCIACFNYINLATARSVERAKEVGVRKAVGASHAQLVSQFMSESLLITALAAGVGHVLAWLALPTLNALSQKSLSLNILNDPQLMGVSLLLIFLVTGLAGLYPSFIVAAFRPVDSLKNQVLRQPGGGGILRQMLVIFQFTASAMLVVGTVVVWQQLTYIRHYAKFYEQDQRLGRLFIIFAAAALFIAGLGLLGLSSYATQRHTKEIGIRKVLGASVGHLLLLLSSDAIRLIIISLVVAIPIANYFVQEWLASYRTRIEINVWIYASPAVAILLIALLTISTQTLRAATRNPVDSLRDE